MWFWCKRKTSEIEEKGQLWTEKIQIISGGIKGRYETENKDNFRTAFKQKGDDEQSM